MVATLKDKVIFITGGSRGIGREIALRCAKEGASIVVAAKTSDLHPTLAGTIHSVANEIEQIGGKALPLVVDVRDEEQVSAAVENTIEHFGKIDALINNASAINLSGTLEMPMKRFDLLLQVNMRATYMCSKLCLPHLCKSDNPHIINLSPPLNMQPKWFKKHLAYTMSKYGMSMCTLGMAEEFKEQGVAVNSLWPKAIVATAAIEFNFPKKFYQAARNPLIVADAAYEILISNSREVTGNFFTDEDLLKSRGVSDFDQYAQQAGQPLIPDFYLE